MLLARVLCHRIAASSRRQTGICWNGPYSRSCEQTANAVAVHAHLSEVRPSSDRDDADRRLPVLLRLQGLRRTAQASLGRLLCFLFLRVRAVSANPREWERRMLSSVRARQSRGRMGYELTSSSHKHHPACCATRLGSTAIVPTRRDCGRSKACSRRATNNSLMSANQDLRE
jgi:hypothetical protein